MLKITTVSIFFLMITNCASVKKLLTPENKEQQVTLATPLDKAISISIKSNKSNIDITKKIIKNNNLFKQASRLLTKEIINLHSQLSKIQLINATNLFQYSKPSTKQVINVFDVLLDSDNFASQKIAWILASNFPSQELGKRIENFLTESITNNEINTLINPHMADAIANNNLIDSYTIVKQGLFTQHHLAYTKAMKRLNPKQASLDFLDYLAIPEAEEVRQLNFSSINMFICYEILNHFTNNLLPINHPNFKNLFFYSVSRNNSLAELARKVIHNNVPQNKSYLAALLAQTPLWVQMSFVERTRRNYSTISGSLLSELKGITSHKDVMAEISNVLR